MQTFFFENYAPDINPSYQRVYEEELGVPEATFSIRTPLKKYQWGTPAKRNEFNRKRNEEILKEYLGRLQ